jgi:hypothetical protein
VDACSFAGVRYQPRLGIGPKAQGPIEGAEQLRQVDLHVAANADAELDKTPAPD